MFKPQMTLLIAAFACSSLLAAPPVRASSMTRVPRRSKC